MIYQASTEFAVYCLVYQWSSLVFRVLVSSTRTKLYFLQMLILIY